MGPELKTRAPKFKFHKGFHFQKGVAKFGYRSHSPQWKFLGIPLCSGEKLEAHVQNIWRFFSKLKKGILQRNIPF
jgi:hypothetical protein